MIATGTALVTDPAGIGDFILHIETDVISDVNKIHEHGFTERMNSTTSLLTAIDSLKRQRILP